MEARKALVNHVCYKIGDGKDINLWEDPWLPKSTSKVLKAKEGVDVSQWDKVEKLR